MYRFDWQEQKHIPEFRSSKVEFVSNRRGTIDAIVVWWELKLDSSEDNVISCAPDWAGGGFATQKSWRFHWKQNVYFGMNSAHLFDGTTYYLESYHDATSFWFQPISTGNPINDSLIGHTKDPQCTCGIHVLLNPIRMAMLSDPIRNAKYIQVLQKYIISGKSVCLCVSDFTVLPIMAIRLGAKKVFVLINDTSHEAYWNEVMKENNISKHQLVLFNRNYANYRMEQV